MRSFSVPKELLDQTERALRTVGENEYECFVLWSGRQFEDQFQIQTAHVPEQASFRGEDGLHVRIDGKALHGLNAWLFEAKQILAVQVHTHPGEAYHSETDDTFPIVTALGGLSIVVPDFGRFGVITGKTAVYRLGDSGWSRCKNPLRDLLKTV